MISNFKLFPNFNISQNFVQNVQKQKNTFVLSLPHDDVYLYRVYNSTACQGSSTVHEGEY